jgi:hypothetical protein
MVHAEIVCDTHGPGQEFTFLGVAPSTDRVNDLDEHVLEDVLGKVLVLYEEEDRGVQFVLVADHEYFERIQVAVLEILDQLMVGFGAKCFHNTSTVFKVVGYCELDFKLAFSSRSVFNAAVGLLCVELLISIKDIIDFFGSPNF